MKRITSILVPVDFGTASEHALEWAVDLAETLSAKLCAVFAYELPLVGLPDGALLTSADAATRISVASQAALDKAVARFEGGKVPITALLRLGDAREVILATTKEVSADLIVMGTHGRTGLARALIGSVTESVVRASEVPVLTVH